MFALSCTTESATTGQKEMLGNGPNKVQEPFSSTWPDSCRQLSWGAHHMPSVTEGQGGQAFCCSRGNISQQQLLYAAASPVWPKAPSDTSSATKSPFSRHCWTPQVPKRNHPSCPGLRLCAFKFPQDGGQEPAGQGQGPEWSTPAGRLQACEDQLPSDSQVPPRQALQSHFLFRLEEAEQTQGTT